MNNDTAPCPHCRYPYNELFALNGLTGVYKCGFCKQIFKY